MKARRGQIPWGNVGRRLHAMRYGADAEKYMDPASGERATVFDHVYRVRPRLVSAWSYATGATRTDWEPE